MQSIQCQLRTSVYCSPNRRTLSENRARVFNDSYNMLRAQVQPIRPHQRISATARQTRGTCSGLASVAMRYGSSVASKRRRDRPKISVEVERDARDPRRRGVCGARRFFVRGICRATAAVTAASGGAGSQSGLSRSYVMHGANRHHRRRHVRHSPHHRRLSGVCTVMGHGQRVAKCALTQTHSRTKA